MFELACPACNQPSQYDFNDYLLMCPSCSCTYKFDSETGQKDIYGDHFIVANSSSPAQVKELVLEWLKRLNHKPGGTEREYFITSIQGVSVPFWIVSVEVHTAWKGLVKRQNKARLETHSGSDYLIEDGQFKRSYRWAVSARDNICEAWGMTRLHEPKEDIRADWDGFPLDSTFSRGLLHDTGDGKDKNKSAYDAREFFDVKFWNGLPIAGVQISEEEALRRTRLHLEQYHLNLAKLNADYLTDYRSEIEIAGIQLIHLPFWYARYVYQPRSFLRHFYRPREKNVIIDGYNNGILAGELAIHHKDKVWVNAGVCAVAAVVLFILGAAWHPAFLLVALFAAIIAAASSYIAVLRGEKDSALSYLSSPAREHEEREALRAS